MSGTPGGAKGISVVVAREQRGARLDQLVATAMRGRPDAPSRAEVQRWIAGGRVRVDGEARKAAERVAEGARITIEPAPPARTEAEPDASVAFDVLYADDALVVVNKPAGLVVHPARGHAHGTLVNGLLARGLFDAGDLASDGGDRLRPGIVHRLDKGTSGVLVVARTAAARERLKAQFAAHTIEREYEALCVGEVKPARHETLHGRHPKDRLKFTSRVKAGKLAVTNVRVVERFGRLATHVACSLETGRTHQIRVHLAESGTPVLGDPLYGGTPKHPLLREIARELGHQALHARRLGFLHPSTQKPMRFESPPPADFVAALKRLRAS